MSKPLLPTATAVAAVTAAFCGKGIALASDLKGIGAIPENAAELLNDPLALTSVLAASGIILATDLWQAVSADEVDKRAEHDHQNLARILLSIFQDTSELRRRAPFAGFLIDQIERGELQPDQLEIDSDDPAYPAIALYRAARESEQRLVAETQNLALRLDDRLPSAGLETVLQFTDETARIQLAFLESNHRALLELIAASNASVQEVVAHHTDFIRADLADIATALSQLVGKIDDLFNRFPLGSREAVTAARIREQLTVASVRVRDCDLAEAEAATDWRARERLRDAAAVAHSQRLSRVDDLAETFTLLESGEESSATLAEMLRIFGQQGAEPAIAYIQHRRASILEKVSVKADDARRELQPLFRAAQLALTAGRNDEAESLLRDLVRPHHPGWPEARHELWSFLVDVKGPRAQSHGVLETACAIYEESEQHARRLTWDDPESFRWQRALSISLERLGDVVRSQGQLDEAARHYAASFAIREKLVTADAKNREWMRDLSVGYQRLGDTARGKGRLAEAACRYSEALAITQNLAGIEPDNLEWQRDLSVDLGRIGDVSRAQGRLAEAACYYTEALAVRERLVVADNLESQRDLALCHERIGDVARAQKFLDKAIEHYAASFQILERLVGIDRENTRWQHDISRYYSRLGDVALEQTRLEVAASHYNADLLIMEKLAAADPRNTGWQRDLSISLDRLGNVARLQGRPNEAARRYVEALAIRQRQAAVDLDNVEWQRDLFVSHWKLADLMGELGDEAAARVHWKASHDALDGIDRRGLHVSAQDRRTLESLKDRLADGMKS